MSKKNKFYLTGDRARKGTSRKGRKILSVTMDDCKLQTFAAGGPGGQNQNTSNTGVRIIHCDSGAVGEARDSRSQDQNKKQAWKRMADDSRFTAWLAREVITCGRDLGGEVLESMRPENLRVEALVDGKWKAIG